MKKRLLTLTLALLLVFTMAVPAFADTTINQGSANKTGSTDFTYTVASTYTVTIPAAVTIDAGTKTGTMTLSVLENAFIDYGKRIIVTLTTCDFLISNNDDHLTYTITGDGTPTETVALNGIVLSHAAGTLTASSEVLTVAVTGSAKYSGAYTDSVTFTVSVE